LRGFAARSGVKDPIVGFLCAQVIDAQMMVVWSTFMNLAEGATITLGYIYKV